MDIIIGIIGAAAALVAGLLLGLRLGSRPERARRVDLQDRLTEAQVALAREQERVVELTGNAQALQARLEERDRSAAQFDEQMRQTIDALSRHALSRNSEEFLKLAAGTMEALGHRTEGALATGEERIKGMVEPLTELLRRYDVALGEMEQKRQAAYSTLEERLRAMLAAEQGLQSETNKLVTALRAPQVRGRWGEMTLRNAVEAAGMSRYCDFVEQAQVSTEAGALRPDMIVNLPGGKKIIVDSKVPMDAYLKAVDSTDAAARELHLRDHAVQCQRHLDSLTRKSYWDQFEEAPNCVVMFIPGEALFAAAMEADADLLARGLSKNVIMATPATLVAMLYAVNYGWQQQMFTESATAVRKVAGELYDRLGPFMEHLGKLGTNLNRSVGAYNDAVGSLESRVVVSARKLKEMGVTGKGDLPELGPLDTVPRRLESEPGGALPPAEESADEQTD